MSIFRKEFPTLPKFSREDREYFLRELALAAMLEEFVGIPENQESPRMTVPSPTQTAAQPASLES